MVEHLMKSAWLFALLLLIGIDARSQTLVDPTRPPASLMADSASGALSASGGPVLQSVLVSPHRVVAIVSGEVVKVGDKIGEARVVKISESEIVLRRGKQVQILKLYPDIEKQPASEQTGSKQKSSGNRGK